MDTLLTSFGEPPLVVPTTTTNTTAAATTSTNTTSTKVVTGDANTTVSSAAAGGSGSSGSSSGGGGGDRVKGYFKLLASFLKALSKAHEENMKREEFLLTMNANRQKKAAAAAAQAQAAATVTVVPQPTKPAVAAGAERPALLRNRMASTRNEETTPVDNIFGRFHSLQTEQNEEVLNNYRMKLSCRQRSTRADSASMASYLIQNGMMTSANPTPPPATTTTKPTTTTTKPAVTTAPRILGRPPFRVPTSA
eukprot:scaffold1767_cov178-Ochromonas_danica.AAC.12